MAGSDDGETSRRTRWVRRLAVAAACGLALVVAGWAALRAWANGGGLATLLEEEVRAGTGLELALGEVAVGWTGALRVRDLAVEDPRGTRALAIPLLELDWRAPWRAGPWGTLRAAGADVRFEAEHWRGWRPGSGPGRAPARPLSGVRLSRAGTLDAGARPLLAVALEGGIARVRSPLHGIDWSLGDLEGQGMLHSGGEGEVERLTATLAGSIPLEVRGEGGSDWLDGALEIGPCSFEDLAAVPPLAGLLAAVGLQGEGRVEARLDAAARGEAPPELSGVLETRGLALDYAGERPLGPLDARWSFTVDREGRWEGPLVAPRGRVELGGVALPFRDAEGELRLSPTRVRLARLRGEGPVGPMRLGLDVSWGRAPRSSLAIELGGAPGHWLENAVIEVELGRIQVRDLRLRGEGFLAAGEVALVPSETERPDWRAKPTWEVPQGRLRVVHEGRTLDLSGLSGQAYLDREGSYSFRLGGSGAVFHGQWVPGGGLRVWVGGPGEPVRSLELGPGAGEP